MSADLQGKHIVPRLSGGIAYNKPVELVKAGASVQVVMTDVPQQFIKPVMLQALSNRLVRTRQWDAWR